jgi:oligopeptide transport system ATP-binding protein
MLLECVNLKKTFPGKKTIWGKSEPLIHAVNNVSLFIKEGENLGLVGESGSGKTTLGRLFVRLYELDSGKIFFNKKEITALKRGQGLRILRRDVQMVFQDPYSSLDPRYTIRRVLMEAIDQLEELTRIQKEKRLVKILTRVGLPEDALGRYPHEFSGGERQRIAIARALLRNPKLLILDEAVSSLDVLIQQQIIELLRQLQKDFAVTYLFITHNLQVVRKLCQRIAVMYQGRIVELAKTETLFQNPLHPYTQGLLSAAVNFQVFDKILPARNSENSRLVDAGDEHFVID